MVALANPGPNPFYMGITSPASGVLEGPGNMVSRAPTAPPSLISTTWPVIFDGQSNITGTVNASYTPPNAANIHPFNIYDGAFYAGADPMYGGTGAEGTSSVALDVANQLITSGFCTKVVPIQMAVGASSIAMHNSGGQLYHRKAVAAARFAIAGIVPKMIVLVIGETDKQLGTTTTAFRDGLRAYIDHWRALGVTCPIFLTKSSWISGSAGALVQAGVDAAVGYDAQVYAGANTDTLNNTNRQADQTHYTAAGRAAARALHITAIDAVF